LFRILVAKGLNPRPKGMGWKPWNSSGFEVLSSDVSKSCGRWKVQQPKPATGRSQYVWGEIIVFNFIPIPKLDEIGPCRAKIIFDLTASIYILNQKSLIINHK